ncbi:LysR substrate-binding domain-containing protein [Variovorax sp. J22P271]|uniref:LysR family transcriptional regulator n=1 Tax=Variovorax davisae TaxID=3053515 RepID=UPI0025781793|nr:LysR substrate-binding domain-containing protein [Variovorax sp. J22P271]MDM0036872.1 LysR substrate-binding domain-containing protein [Variovorax sp. J22P271]
MKLHHLRDLLAVADHGSLRAAAREIGIAQPAMTRSIQELERELGVALFERRSRGIVPTAIGEAFIRRARSVDNELLRARDEVAQLRGLTHGSVRVALSMVPHMALLPEVLRPFRQRFPDVRLDILDAVFPTVAAEVQDGTIDCYVGPPPENLPEGLLVEKLFDNTRVIVGRRGHPLGSARSLSELVEAEWLTTSITAQAEHELGPLFAQHGLRPPTLVMQAHSALTLIVTLLYSDLLAMLPSQWMRFPLTRDVLQAFDISEPLAAPPICIIQRAGLPLTPAAEHLCDLLRRAAAHMGTGNAGDAVGV